MSLSEEQIEILADKYIIGLYQSMEQEVIADIARRVKKMERFTETAELMAKSMVEQGYSAVKIRAEVMKYLNADKDYQKAIAENTKEYKQEIQNIIDETVKTAKENGDRLIAEAGNMAWNNDLSMWEEHGVDLKKPNDMSQLMEAFKKQTAGELKNITRSTGFKNGVLGTTGVLNAFQREMDLAVLKVASGTFSYDVAVNDCIKRLAQKGLRTIDYASGRSYQLDTAARMCVRTGMSQLAGKITEMNLQATGQDLVRTSQHMGSRPDHVPWQNKIFSYSGKNKKYPDFFKETGYGTVSGLKGANCTHDFYPHWEGDYIPPDVEVGEEYYKNTQKQRSMERGIRATKREIEAQNAIGGDTTQLKSKLRQQEKACRDFSKEVGIRPKENRLVVVSGTSDLNKAKSYKKIVINNEMAAKSINNLNFPFNDRADFSISITGISKEVCETISMLSKDIAKKGYETGKEYAYALDRISGNTIYYEEGEIGSCMSRVFMEKLKNKKEKSVILLHNHTDNKGASYIDLNTILKENQVYASVIACNNGDMHFISNKKSGVQINSVYDLVFGYDDELVRNELKKIHNYSTIKDNIGAMSSAKEEMISRWIIRDCFEEGI